MKLSNRLQKVADFIEQDSIVVDVGTDHGYIPIYLIENKISKYVYATDINQGPLNSAKIQIEEHGYQDFIEPMLSNGLKKMIGVKPTQIIIAGMGGVLIKEIIADSLEMAKKADSLVLQPMTGQDELRKYLLSAGFEILDEELAKEKHRIYQIILAKYTGKIDDSWNEIDFYLGKRLLEKNHLFLEALIDKYEKKWLSINRKCKESKSNSTIERISESEKMLMQIERLKHEYNLRKNSRNNR
ncbi:tRNA (adenine(22)-N(1))-methyltransferase [Alkalibacter mobilis]|uniref:tRNA (adenine(22)-N(1))-methyltransferase n=1 Tax=Alkalibacter mobilis TaxID=2787712 RepID=UPI00189C64D2|nr:class I SAM-dependent methyltransferase [Alkalibacter mobilis]MBF7097713.1 SAM-dependent methyltransferase [Alkalibacter mobilis]